jgi:hypothetical protein
VFYDSKTGAPRSLKQIYAFFDAKFQSSGTPTMVASQQTPAQDESVLRTAGYSARPPYQPKQIVYEAPDPFARLAALMANNDTPSSMMRIATGNAGADTQNNWQIFPPTLYGKLSLSPAQMMMLSSFNA